MEEFANKSHAASTFHLHFSFPDFDSLEESRPSYLLALVEVKLLLLLKILNIRGEEKKLQNI